ncbi:MAG: glycosyltransferase [bacterium]|nr:glycosyltransferase [bacterium]
MKIKRLLIASAEALVRPKEARSPLRALKDFRQRFRPVAGTYDGELQYYGDLPAVLGRENVFLFGEFHPHLHAARVAKVSPYPSLHGTPRPAALTEEEVRGKIGGVDAVFVSTRAGGRGELVRRLARERGIPVALFDFADHHMNYGAVDIRKELTYGFAVGRDYDLYFKKDLPLGYGTNKIVPLCPAPVRPESFHFPHLPKDQDIFYSGRPRIGLQADREELLAAVRDEFPHAAILEHESRGSFLTTAEYWRHLARSHIALSPSGKVWDSYRHCETGLAPQTLLVAPKPYVETVGPPLEDGVNAVLYETELRGGRYHLMDAPALMEKIRYYLGHPGAADTMADRWAVDVRAGHTVLARSRYILDMMERAF